MKHRKQGHFTGKAEKSTHGSPIGGKTHDGQEQQIITQLLNKRIMLGSLPGLLSDGTRFDIPVLTINRGTNSFGNKSWGKIDFLVGYCGYRKVIKGKINGERKAEEVESTRDMMESESYKSKRLSIQREIMQESELVIDRKSFAKTDIECQKLHDARILFNKLKKDPTAHKASRIEFIKAILDSEVPSFGICNIRVAAL